MAFKLTPIKSGTSIVAAPKATSKPNEFMESLAGLAPGFEAVIDGKELPLIKAGKTDYTGTLMAIHSASRTLGKPIEAYRCVSPVAGIAIRVLDESNPVKSDGTPFTYAKTRGKATK